MLTLWEYVVDLRGVCENNIRNDYIVQYSHKNVRNDNGISIDLLYGFDKRISNEKKNGSVIQLSAGIESGVFKVKGGGDSKMKIKQICL